MTAAEFFIELALLTLSQLVSLFAGFLVFGLLIHFISHLTFNSLGKAFGNAGMYVVAWLGTPIHELGHALFCIIFRHKIVRIEFFKPDPQTGTLGYVNHQWNRSSLWQVLGNFFIGVGPLILGCLALLGIFYWLVPDSAQAWESIRAAADGIADDNTVGGYLAVLKDSLLTFTRLLFTADNITGWQFWVFCYLSICVAANIRLSWSDIRGSLSGFGCVIVLLILVNVIGLLFGLGSEWFLPYTASSLSMMYGLFVLALIMTGIGFVITYLVSATWVKIRYGRVLNPF